MREVLNSKCQKVLISGIQPHQNRRQGGSALVSEVDSGLPEPSGVDSYKGKQMWISSGKDIRTSSGQRPIRPSDAVVDDVSENPPLVLPLKNASYILCGWIGVALHNRYVETALIEEA